MPLAIMMHSYKKQMHKAVSGAVLILKVYRLVANMYTLGNM